MIALILVLCVWLALSVGLIRLVPFMQDAFYILTFPFRVLWWLLSFSGGQLKWLNAKIKAWKRKPAFGDSAWASASELRAGGNLSRGGFPVGKLGKDWVYTHPEKSVVMQAQAGYGKSLTMGATFVKAEGEDLVSFDPAGQHYESFAGPLILKGYRVLRIDLNNPAQSALFDPSWFLEGSDAFSRDRDLKTLAQLMFARMNEGDNVGQHFTQMGSKLIAGTLDHLMKTDRRHANMYGVARSWLLLTNDQRKQMLKDMRLTGTDTLVSSVNAFEEAGDRERGSYVSTLTNALEIWTWKLYRELCSWAGDIESRWSWEELWSADKPSAVFVTGGMGQRESVESFLRVFFGLCAASRARAFMNGMVFQRPMKMLIDEADSLGGCLPIANIITELRKANTQVFLSYQSMSQLYRNYGKAMADTIVDNCEIVSSGGIKDIQELKRLSQLIGMRTVKSLSVGKGARGGTSENEAGRPLVPVEDIFRLPKDELIALLGPNAAKLKQCWRIQAGAVKY